MANLMLLSLYLSFSIISTLPCRSNSEPPCLPSGSLWCGNRPCRYNPCSPPMASASTRAKLTNNDLTTASTSIRAKLTNNNFSGGGDGGGKSECDKQYHDNSELIVALPTSWYEDGSRCGKMIHITANNGMSVLAKVVDKCDSMSRCNKEHNIVDGSDGVWNALGLDKSIGEADITWSMA